MRYLCSCAALLLLPWIALSQWGSGGCFVPAAEPVGSPAQTSAPYWRSWDNDYAYLYQGTMHVGSWVIARQKYRALLDYDRGIWGPEQDSAPIPVPQHLLRKRMPLPIEAPKVEPWQTTGVSVEQMHHRERHAISGREVTAGQGLTALTGKGALPEDKDKLFLVVSSEDKAKRDKVTADVKANPQLSEWVDKRCHFFSVSPKDSIMVDRQKVCVHNQDADLVVSLMAPDGTELWHDTGYHGLPSLQGMRKKDPNYRPEDVPGPNRPNGGFDNKTLLYLVGFAVLAYLIFRPKENR
ncbi:MAG TPA: hypothetical protein VFE62_20985 [Gemmataceae bacterium]|nr:hypothetical protein [Gemmataceae bacterium]